MTHVYAHFPYAHTCTSIRTCAHISDGIMAGGRRARGYRLPFPEIHRQGARVQGTRVFLVTARLVYKFSKGVFWRPKDAFNLLPPSPVARTCQRPHPPTAFALSFSTCLLRASFFLPPCPWPCSRR